MLFRSLTTRFRQLAKNALIREEQNDFAFNYIQFLLAVRKDPYDIRDRGLVLALSLIHIYC